MFNIFMCVIITLMNSYYSINREIWESHLLRLTTSHIIFAAIENGYSLDYELLNNKNINAITYNKPKPVTPLKTFFLPVKENVTTERKKEKPRIIIGTPNCDIEALAILDEFYLDKDYEDSFYRERRESTIIISSDCFDVQEHCHCTSYNIKPYSSGKADLAIIRRNELIFLRVISEKGSKFIELIGEASLVTDKNSVTFIDNKHRETEEMLSRTNKGLPDQVITGKLIKQSDGSVWKKYSSTCVSCGACTTICPTCTCFLLIDKPGFHKVKQMDACQYPGFERVAGGEDALGELQNRFKNRYMCKYIWKASRFSGIACTGCGRCIEACIGKINKNEIFMELAK
jgi:sulfhydrogenase subunit beta (sulfur reductase)